MKIITSSIWRTEVNHTVEAMIDKTHIEFSITTINGKVEGDMNNALRTSQLQYFDKPVTERQQDFEKLKAYVERKIN